jgi:hypothetical protein
MNKPNRIRAAIGTILRQGRRGLGWLGYHSRPSFIIIGAQKAGSTAMFTMLGQHPQIVAPKYKELDFFNGLGIQYGDFLTYHSMFPLPYRLTSGKITYQGTPNYLHSPDCPQRIYDYAPDMKLIAVFRDPVARAYSSWTMYRRFANSATSPNKHLAEYKSFEEAIVEELELLEKGSSRGPGHYVKRGMYIAQKGCAVGEVTCTPFLFAIATRVESVL